VTPSAHGTRGGRRRLPRAPHASWPSAPGAQPSGHVARQAGIAPKSRRPDFRYTLPTVATLAAGWKRADLLTRLRAREPAGAPIPAVHYKCG
jgi:hypothetical protein